MPQEADVRVFASILETEGLHPALAFLNSRTPHRCTAVYRNDGHVMSNLAVYDRMDPACERGIDVAVEDAYCSRVGAQGAVFEFRDTRLLPVGEHRPNNPVVCYCGVVISDGAARMWGTLCHYDFKPCEMRKSDTPLLQAVAPLVYRYLAAGAAAAQPAAVSSSSLP